MQRVKITPPLDMYSRVFAKQKAALRITPLGLFPIGQLVLPLYIGIKNKIGWDW